MKLAEQVQIAWKKDPLRDSCISGRIVMNWMKKHKINDGTAKMGDIASEHLMASRVGDIVCKIREAEEKLAKEKASKEVDIAALKKGAEAGNVEDQYKLAECYRNGIGVEENLDEFFKWAQLAAQAGKRKAMYFVAEFFFAGDSIDSLIIAFAYANAFCYCSSEEVTPEQIGNARVIVERAACSINDSQHEYREKAVKLTKNLTAKYCSGVAYSIGIANNFGIKFE